MSERKRAMALVATCALLSAACGAGGASAPVVEAPTMATPSPTQREATVRLVEDPFDVPYVPTPDEVVARMLDVANVRDTDVVYDLGSGDGRIVITTARERGARGVGYDLNPRLIAESRRSAEEAGVSGRVRFERQDLFEADIKEATVVTLYLLPEVNMRLRPRLLAELKPGTRVVSHNYDMGDWAPESVSEMDVGGTTHYVYYWVVPPGGRIKKQ
jgi:SAM-dependent methyltransferase